MYSKNIGKPDTRQYTYPIGFDKIKIGLDKFSIQIPSNQLNKTIQLKTSIGFSASSVNVYERLQITIKKYINVDSIRKPKNDLTVKVLGLKIRFTCNKIVYQEGIENPKYLNQNKKLNTNANAIKKVSKAMLNIVKFS